MVTRYPLANPALNPKPPSLRYYRMSGSKGTRRDLVLNLEPWGLKKQDGKVESSEGLGAET